MKYIDKKSITYHKHSAKLSADHLIELLLVGAVMLHSEMILVHCHQQLPDGVMEHLVACERQQSETSTQDNLHIAIQY